MDPRNILYPTNSDGEVAPDVHFIPDDDPVLPEEEPIHVYDIDDDEVEY